VAYDWTLLTLILSLERQGLRGGLDCTSTRTASTFRSTSRSISGSPNRRTRSEEPPEEPLKKDDHDVDALGYILMTRPAPSENPREWLLDEDDRRSRLYWDKSRRGGSRAHSMLGSEA
jgi:hypothetical protein